MPWRLWRKYPGDPHKRRWFVVATVLGMGGLAFLIWVTILGQKKNESAIADRPTADEVLGVLKKRAAADRQACRVVEKKFGAISAVIESTRPNPQTTEYYRSHPTELRRAQRQFDRIVKVFKPRNCLIAYPVPTLKQVEEQLTDHPTKQGPQAERGSPPKPPPPAKPSPAPTASSPPQEPPPKSEPPPPQPSGPLAPVCNLTGLRLPTC